MIVFNVPPQATEHDLEEFISPVGCCFEAHLSRKSEGKPSVGFIFVQENRAERIMANCHQAMLFGQSVSINYWSPWPEDFNNNVTFPKDVPGPTCRLVITKVQNWGLDWVIFERVKAFGEILGYETNQADLNPNYEQSKDDYNKIVNIYLSQKSAEVAARYFSKIRLFGRRIEAYVDASYNPDNDGIPQHPLPQKPKTTAEAEQMKANDPNKKFYVNLTGGGNPGFNQGGNNSGWGNGPNMGGNPMDANPMAGMMEQQMQMMQNQMNQFMSQMQQTQNTQGNAASGSIDKTALGLGATSNTKSHQNIKMPASQAEVDELVKQRNQLENFHAYEDFLLHKYNPGGNALPTAVPPIEFFDVLHKRLVLKIKLSKALEMGFNIGTSAPAVPMQNQAQNNSFGGNSWGSFAGGNDNSGFGSFGGAQNDGPPAGNTANFGAGGFGGNVTNKGWGTKPAASPVGAKRKKPSDAW